MLTESSSRNSTHDLNGHSVLGVVLINLVSVSISGFVDSESLNLVEFRGVVSVESAPLFVLLLHELVRLVIEGSAEVDFQRLLDFALSVLSDLDISSTERRESDVALLLVGRSLDLKRVRKSGFW